MTVPRQAFTAAVSGERRPVPARITIALDACSLHGPDVDLACGTWEGNPAGDVDAWEEARAVPTGEQIAKLAALTDMPVDYFYDPVEQYEQGRMFLCDRSKRKHGLTVLTDRVDERGVLHREYSGGGRG